MTSQLNHLKYFNKLLLPIINKIHRLSVPTMEKALKSHDMTLAEFRIVGLLMGEKLGYNQKQLANRLGISPPSLSVSIQRLESKNVIQRVNDKDDKRIKRIRISSHVDFKDIGKLIMDFEGKATIGINERDLEITKRVLNQIVGNINPSTDEGG